MRQDQYAGKELLGGQFRVIERIGSGGMGAVYKAHQPSMDRFVAVKILHAKFTNRRDLVSRFRREARAMSHLTHPHIAKVFLYDQLEDGACFIVMEYLEGKNLGQIVRHDGPMEPTRAIRILIRACGALEEAHQKGIVHRDLKPENIFLCKQGGIEDYVKVLDFGLAKVTEREMQPGSLILTQEGMVFGTPEFMSPEQAQGKTLDPRSDVYSLAVILYELVTGKLPFDARSPMEYITLHVQAQPIPLARRAPDKTFPPGLQEVFDKAMAKDPENRFQSAAAFATALSTLVPDESVLQALSAVASYSPGLAPTQPSGAALRSERPPPQPIAAPNDLRTPAATTPNTTALKEPQEPPQNLSPAFAQMTVPREGLPVIALIAIGVVIGLGAALIMVKIFFHP